MDVDWEGDTSTVVLEGDTTCEKNNNLLLTFLFAQFFVRAFFYLLNNKG